MGLLLAIYLRLSKEDGELIDESNSITNQRFLISDYIENHPELEVQSTKEYVDDGYSGKNFDRPGITQLFQDIREEKMNGIIVKDLSRFGRNHTEVGDYLEKIFPLLEIRFLAVNNNFDSNAYLGRAIDMSITFENLMYDYFSVENSIKIKKDLWNRRNEGKFLGVFAPYGYEKSSENKYQLVIDPEAAEVVRLIFGLYIEGNTKAAIARGLNMREIPTPQIYAQKKGLKYQWKYQDEKKFWVGGIVDRILSNQVYIGNLVFHKKEVLEIGARKTRMLPKQEWVVYEDAHEPIISKEVFEMAKIKKCQIKNNAGGEQRRKGNPDSPIKGLVKCGGCKHNMVRRSRLVSTYYCRHYYVAKHEDCCPVNVKEQELMDLVLVAVRKQALVTAELKELIKKQKEYLQKRKRQSNQAKQKLLDQIEKLKAENFKCYEQYLDGKIESAHFKERKEENNNKIEVLENSLAEIDYEEENSEEYSRLGILDVFDGKEVLTELTCDVVDQLVDGIYVHDDKRVEIIFKFEDEK